MARRVWVRDRRVRGGGYWRSTTGTGRRAGGSGRGIKTTRKATAKRPGAYTGAGRRSVLARPRRRPKPRKASPRIKRTGSQFRTNPRTPRGRTALARNRAISPTRKGMYNEGAYGVMLGGSHSGRTKKQQARSRSISRQIRKTRSNSLSKARRRGRR